MRKIGASKFKEQCLALLESIDEEGIVITKHGKPLAKLVPIQSETKDLIGSLKGKIKIVEMDDDLLSTGVTWNAKS